MPLIFAVALPFLLWIFLRLVMAPGPYNMDQGRHRGSFFPLLILYFCWSSLIFVASMVGALFNYEGHRGWAALILLVAAIDAQLFNGFLVLFYELYMHATVPGKRWEMTAYVDVPGESNYTLTKYETVISLGLSEIVLFIAGLAMTAWSVAQ